MIYSKTNRKGLIPLLIMHFGLPAILLLTVAPYIYRSPDAGILERVSIFGGIFFAIFFGSRLRRVRTAFLVHYYFGVAKQEVIETSLEGIRSFSKDQTDRVFIKWGDLKQMTFRVPVSTVEGKSFGSYILHGNDNQTIAISPILEKRDDIIRNIIEMAHLKKNMATKFIDKKPGIAEWNKSEESLTDFDRNIQPKQSLLRLSTIWHVLLIGVLVSAAALIPVALLVLFTDIPWPWA